MIAVSLDPSTDLVASLFVGPGKPPAGRPWVQVRRYVAPGSELHCDNLSAPQAPEIIGDGPKCDNLSAPTAERLSQPDGDPNELSRT
jgi:hypothetical protein